MHPEHFARIDFNAPMYAEIAMNAFYEANNIYRDLEKRNFPSGDICDTEAFMKNVSITVVFSAMTVESFLNDYAATCLGDSEFYGDFDKLSAIGKLQLITKFILQSPIDKSRECYYRTKKLFRDRDSYVHNKSKELTYDKLLNNQIELTTPKELIDQATNGIKAIRDIALFFDSIDSNAHAVSFLIDPQEVYRVSDEESKIKKHILEILGIKVKI